jgi:hypothetical protein
MTQQRPLGERRTFMRTSLNRWRVLLGTSALLIVLTGLLWAVDDQPTAKPKVEGTADGGKTEKAGRAAPQEPKVLDRQIHDSLKVIINAGADLYNGGPMRNLAQNPAGCYYLYQGSLLTLKPLLGHHPDLRDAVSTALDEADRNPDMRERAFLLRDVLGNLRDKLKPATAKVPAEKTPADDKRDIKIEGK